VALLAVGGLAAVAASATLFDSRDVPVVLLGSGKPLPGARLVVQGTGRRYAASGRRPSWLRAGAGVRLTGWAQGHYISSATVGPAGRVGIRLRRLPAEDNPDYHWVHPGPNPADELACANCHVAIYRQWSASAHSRSAVNPRFLSLFYGTDWYGAESVGWHFAADQPESKAVCATCHLPTVTALEPAAEDPRAARGVDREGVHCDFCHKVAGVAVEAVGLAHGRDAMQLLRPTPPQQIFFGQLDDVTQDQAAFSPLYRSSRYCAPCHEGLLFGTEAYTTWSEWRASSYAARGVQCQDCHMRPDGSMSNIAPGHGGIERDPYSLSDHRMPAADDPETLRGCVRLRVQASRRAGRLEVQVTVRPMGVGHRLPTGSPLRQVLLALRATGPAGPLKLLAGPVLPAVAGRSKLVAAGSPGKLYAKLLAGPDGHVPVPFWRAAEIEADTRLRPDCTDRSRYVFEDDGRTVTVLARLIYRRSPLAVSVPKRWPDADIVMAEAKVVVPQR